MFRPDNRVVLTYLPERPPPTADRSTTRREAERPRRRRHERDAEPVRDGPVVAERPTPGTPRPYDFPPSPSARLGNGLRSSSRDLPGRPLVSATLVMPTGAADEPADEAGATVLAARALTEGTERYDAIALIEADERLGASLHAEAGWDAMTVGRRRPGRRASSRRSSCSPRWSSTRPSRTPRSSACATSASTTCSRPRPIPRRRAEEAFVATIYAPASPYHRPAGGTRETVERPRRRTRCAAPRERGLDPARVTLVVGGDLDGHDVAGDRRAAASAAGRAAAGAGRARADRGHGVRRRAPRPGRPPAGLGPDRDPRSVTSACPGGSRTSTPCRS